MIKVVEPIIGAAYDSLTLIVSRCGNDKQKFLNDTVLQDATRLRLEDASENLARVRREFPDYYAKHASAGWDNFSELYSILGKSYDLDKVWLIIQNELPGIRLELAQLI